MNLKALNESYDEYILTEEYLIEGLKIFKESKKLYKFAEKINKKVSKMGAENIEAVNTAKKLSADLTKLADEYKVVEDAFANKELDRKTATTKLKELKNKNETLSSYIKSEKTKGLLGKIGLGVLVGGLVVVLGNILVPSGLLTSIGSALAGGADVVKNALSKVGSFLTGKSAEVVSSGASRSAAIVVPTAMQQGAAAVAGRGSARAGSKLGSSNLTRRRR